MAKDTILVMLSGGLDSVCVLHTVLTSPEYAAYDVQAHHMNLENVENRSLAESIAIKNILHYLKTHGYRDLTYTESTIGIPLVNGKQMRDAHASAFVSGFICQGDPTIKLVALGVNNTDMAASDMVGVIDTSASLFSSFSNSAKRIFPISSYTKLQVRDMLPKGLRDLCWSCRTPNYLSGVPKACGSCKTCVQLSEG